MRDSIRADFIAGLTGAVIVLPQGVAFATIAGLPPQYGLYTAMVTPIIAALFGSSRHLISGPTTAISIIVFSSVSHYASVGTPEFVTLALTLTFLAGVYQFAFGLARLGALVNFVSHTVVIGFTAGAAILIATTQMQHVTGIPVPKGESFLHTWMDLYRDVALIDPYVVAIACVTESGSDLCNQLKQLEKAVISRRILALTGLFQDQSACLRKHALAIKSHRDLRGLSCIPYTNLDQQGQPLSVKGDGGI